jgi:hypothetical protein
VRTCIGIFYYASLSSLCALALLIGVLSHRGWLLIAGPIAVAVCLAIAVVCLTRLTFAWRRQGPVWIKC